MKTCTCGCDHNHYPEDHCVFDIWAPDRHTKINNVAFSAYSFRQQQIEDLIAILIITDNPNDFETQCEAFEAIGLDSDSLSFAETAYIETEIAKRWYR